MNYLIGDIGNTYLKISILRKDFSIQKSFSLKTYNVYKLNKLNFFFKKIFKNNINSQVLFSSVVPPAYNKIKSFLKKKKFKVFEIKSLEIKKLIKIKIMNYNQLGSDRIVNAIATKKYKNSIVIDFGSATTFDIIKNGIYEGGVIAPGVDLSIINLSRSTALLPLITLRKNQNNYGKNTFEALNAGFLWGYEGLINNIINKISLKSKTRYKIILTGGYAKLFKRFIKKKSTIDQNITIKGIAKVYKDLICPKKN